MRFTKFTTVFIGEFYTFLFEKTKKSLDFKRRLWYNIFDMLLFFKMIKNDWKKEGNSICLPIC